MTAPLLAETVATLNEIAKRAPSGRGAGASRSARHSTVLRWVSRGVFVRGVRVKLEAVRVGGQWLTSLEAYARFLAACNPRGEEPARPTMTERLRQAKEADRLLEAQRKRTAGQK